MEDYNYEYIVTEANQPIFVHMHKREINSVKMLEHWHRNIEINYVLHGKADYYVDGKYVEVKAGEIIIINSGSIHKVEVQEENAPKNQDNAITVIMPVELFSGGIRNFEKIKFQLKPEKNIDALKETMYQIAMLSKKEKEAYDEIMLISLTWQLMHAMCRNCIEKNVHKSDKNKTQMEQIRCVIDFIQKNKSEPLTTQLVAKKFNFSREYISRIFKRYTGITISEYIIKTRMEKAYKDLVETNKTVESIAITNGFGEARNFIKHFKRYFNSTPLQYRKEKKIHK